MSSRQEQEAGPSGLDPHEMIQLLGLEMSDSEQEEEESNLSCSKEMADSDEDEICQEVLDRF